MADQIDHLEILEAGKAQFVKTIMQELVSLRDALSTKLVEVTALEESIKLPAGKPIMEYSQDEYVKQLTKVSAMAQVESFKSVVGLLDQRIAGYTDMLKEK